VQESLNTQELHHQFTEPAILGRTTNFKTTLHLHKCSKQREVSFNVGQKSEPKTRTGKEGEAGEELSG